MKIAVIGADTRLGKRIAKDALHRHNDVTVIMKACDWADAARYTVIEDESCTLPAEAFDAVIDVRNERLLVTKDGQTIEILKPATVDEDEVRQGDYECCEGAGDYIGAEDLAIAVVDAAEGRIKKTTGVRRDKSLPPLEDGTGKRRYLAVPDKGIMGKVFHIMMDNIGEYVAHFVTDDQVLFAKKGEAFELYACTVAHCDDEVWFAAFLQGDRSISLILDEAQRLVTMVIGTVEEKKPELVRHEYQFGALKMFNEDIPFRRHGYTDDLVGEKICWHYSPYVNITHCYVNENYVRSSLHNMKELPEDAPEAAKFDAADRIKRWGNLFFEEPAEFVRINPHLYVMSFIEAQRNRIDPLQGGGDMVLTINTRRVHDYGIGFHNGFGRPGFTFISVHGEFDDVKIPFETAPSPYRI